jgi:hypothetical protein
MNEYALTAEERGLVDALKAQAVELNNKADGALMLIAKLRGLEGSLNYANGVLSRSPEATG